MEKVSPPEGMGPVAMEHLEIGQVVSSRAGRDAGRYYVVTRVIDARFAEIADGDLRPVGKPKRKNLRHLVLHKEVLGHLAKRIADGSVSDAELRKALLSLKSANALTEPTEEKER